VSADLDSGVLMDRLPNRVLGALYRNGVFTLEDLCSCPEEHAGCGRGIGKKTMSEIRSFLESIGRGFARPRGWEGCRCPVCVSQEDRRRARRSGDDRPFPNNVLLFRPKEDETFAHNVEPEK
jgi:hypothetical protein